MTNLNKFRKGAAWELSKFRIIYIIGGIVLLIFSFLNFVQWGNLRAILGVAGAIVLIFFGKGMFKRNWNKL